MGDKQQIDDRFERCVPELAVFAHLVPARFDKVCKAMPPMAATAVKGLAHHPHLTENAAEVLARHFRVGRAVEESDYTWALELLTMCTQTALSALQNWHVPDVANWDCCLAYNWADGCLPEGIRELLPCGDGAEELMLSAESVSVRVVGRSRLDWSSGDRDWAITVVRYALMTRCGLARTRYCQSTRCP